MKKQKFNPFIAKRFQEIYQPRITISETEPANAADGDIWLVLGTVIVKPMVSNFAITTDEDVNYTFSATDFTNNYAPENNAFAGIKIISLPSAGKLFLNNAELTTGNLNNLISPANIANLQFRPIANAFGLPYANFGFQAYDGGLFSETTTVTINVNEIADKPTVNNFAITTNEDVNYTFSVLDFSANYSDTENNAFAGIKIISLPSAGKLFYNNVELTAGTINTLISPANIPNLQFRPVANAFGLPYANFGFQAYDGVLFSETASVTVNVNAVADKPTVNNFAITTNEDVNYTFSVLDFSANYSDTENNAFAGIKIISLPTAGKLFYNNVELTAGTINTLISPANIANLQFRPIANAFGLPYANFGFQAYDGGLFSETALVTVNVNEIADKPTVNNFAITTNEDVNYTFSQTDFSANYNDVENNAFAGIKIVSLPSAGKLFYNNVELTAGTINTLISPANIPNLQFRPAANAFGLPYANFGFQAYDGGLFSETATITCNVNSNTVNVFDEIIYLVQGGGNGTAQKNIYSNNIVASESWYAAPISYGFDIIVSTIYRHFFTFDTLHIPLNAILTGVRLMLTKDTNTYDQLTVFKSNHDFTQPAANIYNNNFVTQLGISAPTYTYNSTSVVEYPVQLNIAEIQNFIASGNKVKLSLKATDEAYANGQRLLNYAVIKLVLSYSYPV